MVIQAPTRAVLGAAKQRANVAWGLAGFAMSGGSENAAPNPTTRRDSLSDTARSAKDGAVNPTPRRRKKQRKNWSLPANAAVMKEAYTTLIRKRQEAAPGERVSARRIGKAYGIPFRCFRRCIANGGRPPSKGRDTALIDILENRLLEFINFRYSYGKPLLWPQVQIIARRLAQSTLDMVGEDKALEEFQASNGWLESFRRRHHDSLTSRKPQCVGLARAVSTNPHAIRSETASRVAILEEVDRRNGGPGVAENVPPERIWNTDESGFWSTMTRRKVAAPRGMVDCVAVGEDHGAKISAALLISADGVAAAPFYILPGARVVAGRADDLSELGDGSAYGFTEGGSMTEELWENEYVQHMVGEIRKHVPDGWVLLTMDQYGAHINSVSALEYLLDNQILAYSPHAHSTFFTQALDQLPIRAVKAYYRWLLAERGLTEVDGLDKWQLPALVDKAWRTVMHSDKGRDLIRGAFRLVGLCPLDRDFVESTKHLHNLSAPFDDGMEKVAGEALTEGSDVALMLEGSTVAYGLLMPGVAELHCQPINSDELCVEVRELGDMSAVGGDCPLLYHDPHEGWATVMEAWEGSGRRGFLTAWKKGGIRPRTASSTVTLKSKDSLPSIFGLASCTSDNVRAIANDPNLEEGCRLFLASLNIPSPMKGQTGVELLKHVINFGGEFAALAHKAFPQLNVSKRGKRNRDGEDDDGAAPERRRRQTQIMKATGETSMQQKWLNAESRVGILRGVQATNNNRREAQHDHDGRRAELLHPVMSALRGLYTLDELKRDPTPSMDKMKEYIKKDGRREAAFKRYRNLHGQQGKTPAYIYMFDFIHGGAESHPHVVNNARGALCIADKSEVQKGMKAGGTGPGGPMVISEVVRA